MWATRTPASSCVIPLEAQNFDAAEAAKFECSSCSCVKEAMGYTVCGNLLGMRYILCRMAVNGMFSPGHQHHTSLQVPKTSNAPEFPASPEGLRYWHASPSSSVALSSSLHHPAKSTFHVHSFFSSAIPSHPEYKFPPKGTSQVPSTLNSITVQEPSSTMYFD